MLRFESRLCASRTMHETRPIYERRAKRTRWVVGDTFGDEVEHLYDRTNE